MIDPEKFYSLSEVVELGQSGYFSVRSRPTLLKLINAGRLKATNVSAKEKAVYSIKGEDLISFANGVYTNKRRKKMPMVRSEGDGI